MKPDQDQTKYFRGTLLLLVLGIPCLLSGVVAVIAILETVISGWNPANWFSDNGVDWLVAGGGKGDGERYFRFIFFGAIASFTGYIIRWGYTG